jgi:hypothetical protein
MSGPQFTTPSRRLRLRIVSRIQRRRPAPEGSLASGSTSSSTLPKDDARSYLPSKVSGSPTCRLDAVVCEDINSEAPNGAESTSMFERALKFLEVILKRPG